MYQLHYDILRKVKLYQEIINDYRDELKYIRIYNTFENYYGKDYLRIYFELEIKEDSPKRVEFYNRNSKDIHYYTNENYVSFYLPERTRDLTDQELRNREENLHFDWITNLFEWLNQGHTSPEIIIEPFISQLHKKREEERWDIERKLTKSLILKSFENTVIKVNQLLVIKEYHNSFRLGRVLKSETSNFNLVEVKKDLTRGKRPINYVNIENIYAVIDYNELDRKTDKNLILRNIQNQESFNGLKYIRPSNLW